MEVNTNVLYTLYTNLWQPIIFNSELRNMNIRFGELVPGQQLLTTSRTPFSLFYPVQPQNSLFRDVALSPAGVKPSRFHGNGNDALLCGDIDPANSAGLSDGGLDGGRETGEQIRPLLHSPLPPCTHTQSSKVFCYREFHAHFEWFVIILDKYMRNQTK